MFKMFRNYFGDMTGIAAALFVAVIFYTGVCVFCDKAEPTYTNTVVTVHSGDTVWSIASEFTGDRESVRDVVHRIYKANGLQNAWVYPGQILTIPVAKE